MAERVREGGECELRVRWLDSAECDLPIRVPMGGRWSRKIEGTGEGGCGMVCGGGEVCSLRVVKL